MLSIQTGINEPRYVGMRGIRQVASVEIPQFGASELGVDKGAVGEAGAKVKRLDYFVPALGKGAEMLTGEREQVIDRLIELMKEQRRVAGMSRIFAYITHKAGVADDTALELITAAKKIDAGASPIAIVSGFGSELDAVCDSLKASYTEVWKISNQALAYPNAEIIRQVLVKVVPSRKRVLVAHDHFGIDLAPGLSIKLNAAYVPDVLDIAHGRRTTSQPCARSLADRSARTFVATFQPAR